MKYRTYTHRLSISELVRVFGNKPQFVPLAIVLKLLKSRLLESETDIDEARYSTQEADLLHGETDGLKEALNLLRRQSFEVVGFDYQEDNGSIFTSSLLYSTSKKCIALLIHSRNESVQIDELVTGFFSRTKDGSYVVTGNPNGYLPTPPTVARQVLKSKDLGTILESHMERIGRENLSWTNLTHEDVVAEHQAFVRENNSYLESRGVYERVNRG